MMDNGKIVYEKIGTVHTPFDDVTGMPIQPSRAQGVAGTVEIYPEFKAGLADLDGFSHIILLCHLHISKPFRLQVIPFLDDEARGLFATRAPSRPNPIGLSIVKLNGIQDNILSIEEIDLLDGTPVLDIKPYVGEFDERKDVRVGWLEGVKKRRTLSDGRFRAKDE